MVNHIAARLKRRPTAAARLKRRPIAAARLKRPSMAAARLPRRAMAAGVVLTGMTTACAEDASTGIGQDLFSCAFGGAVTPEVGQVVEASANASFCVEVSGGGEFALVPFLAAKRDTALRVEVTLQGGGFIEPSVSSPADTRVAAAGILTAARGSLDPSPAVWAFHRELRERERAELNPRMRGVVGSELDLRTRGVVGGGFRTAQSAARPRTVRQAMEPQAIPAEGELLELNVAASCEPADRDLHTARVAAVTQRAVVLADVSNPEPTFTDTELRGFAERFDDLLYPLIAQETFGEPSDLDGNGRVLIFFTRAVNELTPKGGTGIVGGFFWGGDLFPRVGTGRLGACEGSNEAEIVYLAVPDPSGHAGPRIPLDALRGLSVSTIGHELQHLVNASRRLYVNDASSFEETWLDEGLSHLAEELLFYEVSGLEPGANIDVQTVTASQQIVDAFNQFALDNFGRYNLYLEATQDFSLIGTDALETRGATWSFMRYALDRDPRSDDEVLHALGNATTHGLDNLARVLGEGQAPLVWMRDWSVSVMVDDLVSNVDPRFEQPSWDSRDLLSALREDQEYPLDVLSMSSGGGISLELQPGSAAYPVFSLAEGGRAAIVVDAGESAPDRDVQTTLVRVR